jgi:hypothetical protein
MTCYHPYFDYDFNTHYGLVAYCRSCRAVVVVSLPELERLALEKFREQREGTGNRAGEPGRDQGAEAGA